MELWWEPLPELLNQLVEVILLSMWLSHLLYYLKHLSSEYCLIFILPSTLLGQVLLGLNECCHELVKLILKDILRRISLVIGRIVVGLGCSSNHSPVKYPRLVPNMPRANNIILGK